MNQLAETTFNFTNQTQFYRGKVRDVYTIDKRLMVMIASDRISAFDVILPQSIPFKGQVLNQIAYHFLDATSDIVPNWLISCPDPHVAIGVACKPFKVEMVIRGYLAGHAARLYNAGERTICGVTLPDGLKENDKLPEPIITPTTKAAQGHDEDISRENILRLGLVSINDYVQLETYTKALFQRGTEMAAAQGLILVDTKYEFGIAPNGNILLIDEIHTPDSSRYFILEGYQQRQNEGIAQKQLSKEFVRQWLIQNGFQGKEGQVVPFMSKEMLQEVSTRYIQLYEQITGKSFIPRDYNNIEEMVYKTVEKALIEIH
jgi:phosphoribosylaminoimidazole-succinocarboxamide synthase